jgi:hypothetical protein
MTSGLLEVRSDKEISLPSPFGREKVGALSPTLSTTEPGFEVVFRPGGVSGDCDWADTEGCKSKTAVRRPAPFITSRI